MTIQIDIHEDSGVAVVSCSGVLRVRDAKQAAKELWLTADWPGKSALWDFREAQFDLSSSDVREIAEFILARQREEPPERMAFVAPRDVDFGMARMFEAFRDDSRTAFRVSRDYDEALSWARFLEPGAA